MKKPEITPLPPSIQAPLDARKERLRAIFNRRSCTAVEMLTADFGHWPPKGLTVTAPPEGPIEIVSTLGGLWKRFKKYNRKELEHFYKFMKKNEYSAWETALGAKIVSALNFADCLKSTLSMLARRETHAFVGNFYPDFININSLSLKFASAAEMPDSLSHETVHVLQFRRKNDPLKDMDDELKKMFTGLDADDFQKYGHQTEIQARIHTLLLKMYQQAQGMPGDKQALWTLLLGCGLFPKNESVHNEIIETITNDEIAKNVLRALPVQSLLSRQFDESLYIGFLSNHMDEAEERKFWFDILPRIYADLLVLYGDTETGKKITGPAPSSP